MASKYVSTLGNNSNNGAAYTTAWRTISHSLANISSGDTIYIAPGTYEEELVIDAANSINMVGDINAQYFLDHTPNYVRITGCSSSLPASSIPIVDLTAVNGYGFYNLIIDGTANGEVTAVDVTGKAGHKFYNCVIMGSNQAIAMTTNEENIISCSLLIGGTNCVDYGSIYKSILIGGKKCSSFSKIYDSILICGDTACVDNDEVYNNLFLGCNVGIHASTLNSIKNGNNLFLGCNYAYNPEFGDIGNEQNIILGSNNIFNTTGGNTVDETKLLAIYTAITQSTAQGNHIGYNTINKLFDIAKALKPDMFQDNLSYGTVDFINSGSDILNYTRFNGDAGFNCGPYAITNDSYNFSDYKTTKPSIQIISNGEHCIDLTVRSGSATTASVFVHWTGSNKPYLRIKSPIIASTQSSATGTGTSWERITVNYLSSIDGTLQLFLGATNSGSQYSASFSEIKLIQSII